jgi:hypothetical protein
MEFRCFFGLFVRVIASVIFGGIFYAGWMAVAIPVLKSAPLLAKAVCWFPAPVIIGAGFSFIWWQRIGHIIYIRGGSG